MAYIKKEPIIEFIEKGLNNPDKAEAFGHDAIEILSEIEHTPDADVVEMEIIKSWLYKIAINNVGCVINGDFSDACLEIISRLDGLRRFAKDSSRTIEKRGEV